MRRNIDARFCEKRESIEKTNSQLHETWVRVGHNEQLKDILEAPLLHDCRATDLLKRPEMTYQYIQALDELGLPILDNAVALQVEIQSKYAGYIQRQQSDIARMQKSENTRIPETLDYQQVSGLSIEVIQKLTQVKPTTIAQAGRIAGVTPAALSLLLVHLKRQRLLA